MCGIAGIFSQSKRIYPEWIKVMTDTIRHRGPDDEGYLAVDTQNKEIYTLIGDESKVDGVHIKAFDKPANLFLGHRRLSIIDPTPSGHQPMSNDDGTVWIVYNGEIYNYIELKNELKSIGYNFHTRTDTEVVLKAYEEWGENCVEKFNGMWAFVIYDAHKNILFGSRDRFGVKPLYYYLDNEYFAFASEIKALLKLPFYKPSINTKVAYDYLVLGLEDQEEETFFKDIYELFPSEAFIFDINNWVFKKWKYYNLDYIDTKEKYNEKKMKEHSQNVRDLIFDAVRLRLRSDVPIGSCLSGGLDSSTIVCVINELLKKEQVEQIGEKQKVFTACYLNEKVDESKWAKIVVNATQTKWYQTYPTSYELLQDLKDLIYYQDLPFGSTSIYAQYRVMKLAKEAGVKVLLDGQGGDELFTGYFGYYLSYFIEILKRADIKNFSKELYSLNNAPVTKLYLTKMLTMFSASKFFSKRLIYRLIQKFDYDISIVNKDFLYEHLNRFDSYLDNIPTTLNSHLYLWMTKRSLKILLRYEDRNSMRFSIEARTPFADDINLIGYVFKIPSVYKIYNGWSKYLLRRAMENILPDEIRWRKDKIGFATPEKKWFCENQKWILEVISESKELLMNYFNYEKLMKDLHSGILVNKSRKLWRILNFIIWRKIFKI